MSYKTVFLTTMICLFANVLPAKEIPKRNPVKVILVEPYYLVSGQTTTVQAVSGNDTYEGIAKGNPVAGRMDIKFTYRISKNGKKTKIHSFAIDEKGYVGIPADVWIKYDIDIARGHGKSVDIDKVPSIVSVGPGAKFTIIDMPR